MKLKHFLEAYNTFGIPDASGIRGHGMDRPEQEGDKDYPYDQANVNNKKEASSPKDDQAYGQPRQGQMGNVASGPSHRGITPMNIGWEGGPDNPSVIEKDYSEEEKYGEAIGTPMNFSMSSAGGQPATQIPGASGGWADKPRKKDDEWDEKDIEKYGDVDVKESIPFLEPLGPDAHKKFDDGGDKNPDEEIPQADVAGEPELPKTALGDPDEVQLEPMSTIFVVGPAGAFSKDPNVYGRARGARSFPESTRPSSKTNLRTHISMMSKKNEDKDMANKELTMGGLSTVVRTVLEEAKKKKDKKKKSQKEGVHPVTGLPGYKRDEAHDLSVPLGALNPVARQGASSMGPWTAVATTGDSGGTQGRSQREFVGAMGESGWAIAKDMISENAPAEGAWEVALEGIEEVEKVEKVADLGTGVFSPAGRAADAAFMADKPQQTSSSDPLQNLKASLKRGGITSAAVRSAGLNGLAQDLERGGPGALAARAILVMLTGAKQEAAVDEKHIGFEKLKNQIAKKGNVDNPAAVAAAIGRRKFGAKGMAKKAAAGKRK